MSTRIHHGDKHSHTSLWLGLVGVIVLGAGGYFLFDHFFFNATVPGQVGYLLPVPNDAKLRSTLSDAQYHVTRENGTETAFQNLFWDNFKPGIYVDVITHEPLFSSADKFEANTGRPAFTKPISPDRIVERHDTSFNMDRTEVRAVRSDSHLGHLFKDGPPPTGLRYAINSAALHFVPLEKMEAQGYKDFIQYVTPGTAAGPAPAVSAAPPAAPVPAATIAATPSR
jgi:peptide methionine sulfoxide reductase msrA/msrB